MENSIENIINSDKIKTSELCDLRGRDIEVDCLKVNKVYDACQQRECIEDQLFDLDFPGGCSSEGFEFVRCEFGKAECEEVPGIPQFTEIDENFARLQIACAVPVFVVVRRRSDGEIFKLPANPIFEGVEQEDNKIRFLKDVVVFAPAEFLRQGRFECQCESYAECDDADVAFEGFDNIRLTIGVFLIVKVISEVQLCIPTFGFCDTPAPCEEFPDDDLFCEVFLDEELTPFPDFFPPQQNQHDC